MSVTAPTVTEIATAVEAGQITLRRAILSAGEQADALRAELQRRTEAHAEREPLTVAAHHVIPGVKAQTAKARRTVITGKMGPAFGGKATASTTRAAAAVDLCDYGTEGRGDAIDDVFTLLDGEGAL